MRTIEEINSKIESGEANIFTAYEFKELIKIGETPSFEEVDVITTGTCGVMSGTSAIFNIIVSNPGVFKRAVSASLNDVPVTVGGCPNEWLGSIDVILNGTTHSLKDHEYGGGFLLKDILNGETIDVELETLEGDIISTTTNIDEIVTAKSIGSRMAFKNYHGFTNTYPEAISSIFAAIPLEGNSSAFTFSGCGDVNPLQNDPKQLYIKGGTKILFNGAEGLILSNGTRSTADKPNLMIYADLKEMDSYYIGGFKTGEGGEVYSSVAVPIPIINEEIYNNVLITNKDIHFPVEEIKGRHLPITTSNYADMWEGHDLRPTFDENLCIDCPICTIEEVCPVNAFTVDRSGDNPSYELDLVNCFGCGMCGHYCNGGAFDIDTGSVHLDIFGEEKDVPIICRQSDLLRGNKLAEELKQRILKGEFKISA